MNTENKVSITILVPAGRLPLEIMKTVSQLAEKHSFHLYLSISQNLRLIDVPESAAEEIKATLAAGGAEFKAPGKFPLPRVCVGMDHCNLAVIDTEALNRKILDKFAGRKHTKAKFKIAISACTMCCSGVKTTDIGIMATRDGYELFAGGKGGPFPKIGRRIARNASEETILEMTEALVEFHDKKTEKKQRMYKLLDDLQFPYQEK
ncbi:MAG: nitrite reductase [Proteobacteria bacterium]|nr:nitrite reductase [Pseudomonadota bacterium]MBU1061057.1 nitrite reductase [Pseudomonadota bacterium]